MRSSQRIALFCTVFWFLTGCTLHDVEWQPRYGPTLADLPPVDVPDDPMPVPDTTINEIENSYRSALQVAKNPDIRHRILIRLADLEMARSENRQLTAQEQEDYFGDAIDMYEELLKLNSQRQSEAGVPTNERLLYQLSKAYALDGKLKESNDALDQLVTLFPESAFAAEADFRRAEQAFSSGDYSLAEKLYAKVMADGKETPFYVNAVYMHGWSQFKGGRYRASINSFTEVMDLTLIKGKKLSELTNSQRNLISDTLRVLSIVFSYLDGADTITEVYAVMGQRHYQYLLYMNLGDLYLEKNRFRDSADTYRHYVKHFPDTDPSPKFSVKAIEVYKQGNFPSLILPAKEEYVRNYGVNSDFWRVRSEPQRQALRPNLRIYLDELSSHYHAEALDGKKAEQAYAAAVARGRTPKNKPISPHVAFSKAADFYQQFITAFPKDKKTPEMAFLMAEAYYESGQLELAIDAYEDVAYNYLDKKYGAKAGYSALVAMQTLIDRSTDVTKARWQAHKINSAIIFADYYYSDKRAAPVLTKAAQELFENGDSKRAVQVATRITKLQPPASNSLRKTAWLVIAHSEFDQKNYVKAEYSYRQVLQLITPTDPERKGIIDRIAASLYKTAETQVAAGNKQAAIDKLLSIRNIAPGSDIAATGQYDAANHLIELKQWSKAEQVLIDFKQRYPQHKLAKTLSPKFVLIYQETKQWDKAASALAVMASSDSDPSVRRQSLYMSAELYEKSGKTSKAISKYRDYANKHPLPFDLATEARFRLVELYGKQRETGKQNFWLRKLIEEHAKAGKNKTERSKYLAAYATSKFAKDDFDRYSRIKLTLPLKKSLKKKKAALDKTLASYKKVLAFGVAEFTTEANHRVGMVYATLSRDLMNSQRPKGLDDMALEQYEILLEEQAYPFEEKAVEIHKSNAERAWQGIYDDWVKKSFKSLAKILPARYGKDEVKLEASNGIH